MTNRPNEITKVVRTEHGKPRKASWEYDDLAQKIQVESRQLAAKLVLRHLASKSNDSGESHHGLRSIAAHCSISRSQTALALKYLRDVLNVVKWTTGRGGNQQATNRYILRLDAMRSLVASQGVFDPRTGKLLRSESDDRTGIKSDDKTRLNPEPSPMVGLGIAKASPMSSKSESDGRTQTTIGPIVSDPRIGGLHHRYSRIA
jgi:hypothetical protein